MELYGTLAVLYTSNVAARDMKQRKRSGHVSDIPSNAIRTFRTGDIVRHGVYDRGVLYRVIDAKVYKDGDHDTIRIRACSNVGFVSNMTRDGSWGGWVHLLSIAQEGRVMLPEGI